MDKNCRTKKNLRQGRHIMNIWSSESILLWIILSSELSGAARSSHVQSSAVLSAENTAGIPKTRAVHQVALKGLQLGTTLAHVWVPTANRGVPDMLKRSLFQSISRFVTQRVYDLRKSHSTPSVRVDFLLHAPKTKLRIRCMLSGMTRRLKKSLESAAQHQQVRSRDMSSTFGFHCLFRVSVAAMMRL